MVSSSAGGVTSTEPLSFASTVGLSGAVVSGLLPALALLSLLPTPRPLAALAPTSEPSCTLSAGIVALPVADSTTTSGLSEVQVPSSPFVKVAVFGLPASSI